jgi:hypothetical protein
LQRVSRGKKKQLLGPLEEGRIHVSLWRKKRVRSKDGGIRGEQ